MSLDVGPLAAPAYFFPMETVFQEAVTALLGNRLSGVSRQRGRTYQPVAGTPNRSLAFAADIVIGAPPRLVIDTKYTPPEVPNRYGGTSFHNQHVYQVVFYALSFGCPAMLVYPKTSRDIDVSFNIEGIAVQLVTVDLSEPGLVGLVALVEMIEALLAEHVAA